MIGEFENNFGFEFGAYCILILYKMKGYLIMNEFKIEELG